MLITNFASGELSKKLAGRIDLQQYYSGASLIKNFEIIPTGGIERRVGTQRLARLSGPCRLIPFIVNKYESFILEVKPGITYIWKNGMHYEAQQQIVNPYENMEQINEIQYAQNYDTLIFVQKNHTPIEFTFDFTTRRFTSLNMQFEVFSNENIEVDDDYDYIVKGTDSTLPAGEFDGQYAVWKGRLWKWNSEEIKWNDTDKELDDKVDERLFTRYEVTEGVESWNKCPSCVCFFNSRLWFASTGEAGQKIWASAAPGVEGQRYKNFATFKKYVTVNKVVKEPDIHIFSGNIKKSDIDTVNKTTKITNLSQDLTDKLKKDLTEYYVYNASVIPGGTKAKSLIKESDGTYSLIIPVALDLTWDKETTITYSATGRAEETVVEQNVKYGITFNLSLWVDPTSASSDDYEYKVVRQTLTTSDCSFNFEIASDQNDVIKWLGANKYMTVGTESSVWCIPSTVTALNVAAEMNGRFGSDDIQGHCVCDAMIFFAQGKHGIREYYYDNNLEAFKTNNIAIAAEQMLTESPAKEFDFVTNPYNRIVITREDGTIVSLLYDKNNGVMAWNRLALGNGIIYSTAVTRGEADTDIIYVAVTVDNENFYLERLDNNEKVYLDSWQSYSGNSDGYTQKAVLYNKTKDIVTDIKNVAKDFADEKDTVYIGYEYESVISSMPVIANDPTGKKRITYLLVRFTESSMPELSITSLDDENFYDVEEPFSGVKQITYPGISDRDVTFTMKTKKVKPCNILSVNALLA